MSKTNAMKKNKITQTILTGAVAMLGTTKGLGPAFRARFPANRIISRFREYRQDKYACQLSRVSE
jgi:hypothetical protein